MGMLSVKGAAVALGISPSKVYALVQQQAITHFRIGGKILFCDDDIMAFLSSCKVGVDTPVLAPTPRAPLKLKHLNL